MMRLALKNFFENDLQLPANFQLRIVMPEEKSGAFYVIIEFASTSWNKANFELCARYCAKKNLKNIILNISL